MALIMTGLELYAFKIKMRWCVVLMGKFQNCLHWGSCNATSWVNLLLVCLFPFH